MKTNFLKILSVVTVAFLSFSVVSCDDDEEVKDNSIGGIVSGSYALRNLNAALDRAGLKETLRSGGPYTIFAPSNEAFEDFLEDNGYANLEAVPVEALKQILLNHVVSGAVKSTDLTNGMYVKTLAKGTASDTNTLSMYISTTSGVRLNGVSNVTSPDIMASNGVIHIVDAVIGLPTIVTHALANPNFSSLVGALTSAGQPDFVSVLSGTTSYTVFAPTNQAFTDLNAELAPGGIASVSAANLTKVLQYHVVSGNILSSTLTNNQSVPTLQTPQAFTIQLGSSATIKDANNRISTITATDVQCSNGAIHVINKVLLPIL